MSKILVVLFALCVVPCIVTAKLSSNPFLLKGSVYCDTCRCGYENDATKYMSEAVVRLECRDRSTDEITFTDETVTDASGHYKFLVHGDRGDNVCDAVLVKSSDPECSEPDAGRERARVILTDNNGMASHMRFANSLGFLKSKALASCAQILQKYQQADD